jgi:cobalt-zinc-cadmium resistance protein CzcA
MSTPERSTWVSNPSTFVGVGLIDDGGNNDLVQGYNVDDLENIVLTQSNGVPVLVKDVAKVSVGHVQR